MDFTQADIDSLARKLDGLTDGEKAALAAAIEQRASDEVAGFQFEKGAPTGLDFAKLDHRLFGTTYGGDGVMTEEIT